MTVSFSPAFNPIGHVLSFAGSVFQFNALTPGEPLIVALMAMNQSFDRLGTNENDTLLDVVTWSDASSGLYTAYMQLITVLPFDTSVTFVMTASSPCVVGVGAQLPFASYVQLPPFDYINVPGVPGSVYANPQDINNVGVNSYISAWLPTGAGTIFGAIFSHTYDADAETLNLQSVIGGDFEKSNRASKITSPFGNSNDPLTMQLQGFVVETNNDPVEIRVNEGSPAEWRWAAALGLLAGSGGGWSVGWT